MSAAQGLPAKQSVLGGAGVSQNYWLITVLRAVPALIVGMVITFMQEHSARVGLLSFGAFAVVAGVIVLVGAVRQIGDRVVRGIFVVHGAVGVIAGAIAIALAATNVAVLLLIVTVYAAITGVLEGYAGLRSQGALQARDWMTVGVFTAIAAIVFVLIPPDSILVTGLIGAYTAILGVFLLIAGLSQKWANDKPTATRPEERKVSE